MEENVTLTPQEQHDEELIAAAFQKLLDTYLASNHRKKVDVITKAFIFAKQAHKGVRRLSGEPYILHPIAVAQIACEEIGLGSTSICAALLHDVEEDTDYTNEDLCNLFGPKVANIVEGLTKIAGGIFGDRASLQAETFKKLLLTMSDDIRVILIKISDRLHNMRTLESMLPSKQYKIAGETQYIFAPIADRLGLNKIKTELENLSFRYEHPEEYQKIQDKLAETYGKHMSAFDNFTPPICERLDAMGMKYNIKARIKSPYSIWKKMLTKHVPFEEIYDILAIRIVFTPADRSQEIADCFRIYSAITEVYSPHPTRFRDWLSNPKANGYQALHNTFMSRQGEWIEVQIRSDRMDDIAEVGFAAHWKYKDAGASYDENELDKWLNSIKEILDDPQPDTIDFLDTIKLNLFASEIMVFTPKGEIKTMPSGSTVLDFAFSIHSFIGSHCIGAKVNHKLVPLSQTLKSGDQVEILTSKSQSVQADWMNYATTAKAKGKIQAILRRENREKGAAGEKALKDFLKAGGIEPTTLVIEKLCALHGYDKPSNFYQGIGLGQTSLSDTDINYLTGKTQEKSGWKKWIPGFGLKKKTKLALAVDDDFVSKLDKKKILVLNEETLQKCEFPTCCHPIPGDDVLGYITPQKTLEIHKRKCNVATKHKTNFGNSIIACSWDTHKQLHFDARIYVKGIDAEGILYAIADVFHKQLQLLIRRITIETNDGIFEGTLEVRVHDTEEVASACNLLRAVNGITRVSRID